MTRKKTVTVVGPGNLGSAMARALAHAGFEILEVIYRGSPVRARSALKGTAGAAMNSNLVRFGEAQFAGQMVWICVGDSAIADTASAMANRAEWKGKIVFHASGALTSNELSRLKSRGARVASVHPMMTFVRDSAPSMEGVWFALEGDAAAVREARGVVKALGGESFEIKKRDKPLYHALGAFVSPLIMAQMAAAEKIGKELGLEPKKTRRLIAPILRRTMGNYLEQGPAAAFSGPIVRGDVATIRRNLAALKRVRGAGEIYRALARVAVEELPGKNKRQVRHALE